jgi:hypothetical protein
MFTWICPKCGTEVPPSYSDCPNCKAGDAPLAASGAPPQAPEIPPTPVSQPSPPSPVVVVPQAAQARPGRKTGGLPGWALSLLFALAFIAIGFGLFTFFRSGKPNPEAAAAVPDRPQLPAAAALQKHPALKYLEITGLRLTEDLKRKAYIQFVVVNHSGAEIADLAAKVGLKAVTMSADQEAVGTFSFKIPVLGPYESKDMKAEVSTKLRVYELPDWQFLRPEMTITSP